MIVSIVFGYRNLANWLYVKDEFPKRLDYICTFAGDHKREIYALELYKRYKPVWIVSTMNEEKFKEWAVMNNVDTKDLTMVLGCRSTFEEVNRFSEILKYRIDKGHKEKLHVGLVSSFYHMRRIKMIQNFSFNNYFFLYSLPVPIEQYNYSFFDLNNWWKLDNLKGIINSEIVKFPTDLISMTPVFGSFFRELIENNHLLKYQIVNFISTYSSIEMHSQ